VIDCALITHFHLDHCGALPYFSEAVGYNGPIIATPPTKAIIPLMLEDFRKVSIAQKGDINAYTSEMIKNCINKISTI
jgi:integrator complex subunit 11